MCAVKLSFVIRAVWPLARSLVWGVNLTSHRVGGEKWKHNCHNEKHDNETEIGTMERCANWMTYFHIEYRPAVGMKPVTQLIFVQLVYTKKKGRASK